MPKRTYNVIYRVRPNKKTVGVRHVQNMSMRGKLKGNPKNAAKLLRVLCATHRVNPDAIVLENIQLVSVRLGLFDWIIDKCKTTHGTQNTGEKHGMSKLVESQVLAIKLRLKDGESQRSIAKDFGIHQVHVSKINRGLAWSHLEV